jgi:hypothetical protein
MILRREAGIARWTRGLDISAYRIIERSCTGQGNKTGLPSRYVAARDSFGSTGPDQPGCRLWTRMSTRPKRFHRLVDHLLRIFQAAHVRLHAGLTPSRDTNAAVFLPSIFMDASGATAGPSPELATRGWPKPFETSLE